jgi:putative aminopeptidase FrvX
VDERLQLLRSLTEAAGAPGFEGPVREVARRHAAGLGELGGDRLGSLTVTRRGTADRPRILLGGHLDEVGFMVTHVTPEGFLRFQTLGGWWEPVMVAQRVTVQGRQGEVPGVIGCKPPHVLSGEERREPIDKRDLFIDVGAGSAAEVEAMGIRPGDPVVPFCPFTEMAGGRLLMGKAFDDRAGCALVLETLRQLGTDHPNTVVGVLTVQEETGLRGAQTVAAAVEPDVAIALDVGIAGDTPGMKPEEARSRLGGGPVALLFDASLIPNPRLRDLVADTAAAHGIPLQYDTIPGGGNDGGRFQLHAAGVPTICLGVAARYIHSAASVIARDDFDRTVDLLVALVRRLDRATVEGLWR